ncbi:MAG: hypothetical protein M3467_09250 [Actinomycetota bacterium]|nr:hypothetical protein [Actinomycetota bacterium]
MRFRRRCPGKIGHVRNSEEITMGTEHTPADDIVYDLVSVQYHALQGVEQHDKYMADAEDHDDVRQFFEQCAEEDARRAVRCHELLGQLTGGGSLRATS